MATQALRRMAVVAALCLIGFAVLSFSDAAADAASTSTTVSMRTGTVLESFTCRVLKPKQTTEFSVEPTSGPSALLLRIVVPDDREAHRYSFFISHKGRMLYKRSGATSGFGRRSFVFPCADAIEGKVQVTNPGDDELHIEELRPLAGFHELSGEPAVEDDFALCLLLNGGIDGDATPFRQLAELPDVPGIAKVASLEIHYAKIGAKRLREDLAYFRIMCDLYGLRALAIPCSWWAGTPPEVAHRRDFQQVCWSPTDTSDFDAKELETLFGKPVDVRYGFTTPNMWGNTPWQTMNHPELNSLRHERLKVAVGIVEEQLDGMLIGHVSENEPAYWAWEASDFRYPVRRSPLYADFNPHTVTAATSDGVTLQPEDGLDLTERRWLHANAARYVQNTIDELNAAGATGKIFSHALLEQMFPMEGTGYFHPYAEIARVRGARVGLETLYRADFDGLWRVRDWGHWGCVNREENDGVAMDHHVAMLQLEYALGADLFNSYNWDSVNENGRCLAYFREFLDSVARGYVSIGARSGEIGEWRSVTDAFAVPLSIRPSFPWANELRLSLKAPAEGGELHAFLSDGVGGDVVAWATLSAKDIPASGPVSIDFGDLAALRSGRIPILNLTTTRPGWQVLSDAEGILYELRCNLRKARQRSQHIISLAGSPPR